MSAVLALRSRRDLVPPLVAATLAAALLTWAKWAPYAERLPEVARTRSLGPSPLGGDAGAVERTLAYLQAVWPALVAGLLLAAAVQVLLPASWLRRALGAEGLAPALRGGLAALPGMMCTCCAAPVAVGLRRRGAAVGPALAVWVGNPALNPVVLVFAALVLPWELVALRAGFGVALVAGLAAVAGRRPAAPLPPLEDVPATASGYLRALARLAARLLPEYLVVLLALGALHGLVPLDGGAVGVGALLLLAVTATLLPVPTGAEVAAAAALLSLGAGAAPAAVVLLALPALSLPSLLMVRRVFPAGLLLGAAGTVAAASATAGLVARAL